MLLNTADSSMYICICNAITDGEIRAAVAAGSRSVDDLRATLGVGSCCGRCVDTAKELVSESAQRLAEPAAAD